MSHEIRTPLNGLLGNLSLLHDTKLTPKQERYVGNMETSGRLLMSHISDVLDITKYDAGKLTLRPVPMNLSLLVQDIVDSQSGAATENGTMIEWGWKGEPVDWINADRERIQHILINIVGNAVKFTHQGRILVKAEIIGAVNDAPQLCLSVSDTGIGIDRDMLSRVFDDFVTGDASYERKVGGTGLGLGIARRFVSALGGTISAQSEKGQGSVFRMQFPIQPIDAPATLSESRTAPAPVQPRNILVVEDNEINRVVVREMLLAANHTVTLAPNGRVGVDIANDRHFDLILMDISMPVMDGRTATRAIRAGNGPSAKTPIVALTANAMAEEQKAFLSDGMNDILTKPLTKEGLLRMVEIMTHSAPAPIAAAPENTHLAQLREVLGDDALQGLLLRFAVEADQLMGWLNDADAQDLAEHAARCHKLAGSAATFGAFDLRNVLLAVENAAKAGDGAAVAAAVSKLAPTWAATRKTLML